MKSLLEIVHLATARPSQPWALATLVRTSGSTYRKPGARLLGDTEGNTTGVLSGGCLEEEIGLHGKKVIETGEPVLLSYDMRRLYGCDGRAEILVERIPPAGREGNLLTSLGAALERREQARVRTVFENAAPGSDLLPHDALVVERPGVFIHAVPLTVRLLLFGDGPEIPPLTTLAKNMGWSTARFDHPAELDAGFRADRQTAAVVMTHNFGRDFAVLDGLLPLGLSYVGLLGPRKRTAQMIARLYESGTPDPVMLDSLHAPAGLDIGSEAPEEVALSILSEVAAVLAERRGGFLRDRREAIHRDAPALVEKSA